jgi:small-conductance mechanosensitive channel
MSPEIVGLEKYIAALVTFGAIVLIGFIIQILISTRLQKIVAKTPWKGDDIIVEGIKGRVIIWSIIIGLYAALPLMHLPAEYHRIIEKVLLVLVIFFVTLTVSSIVGGFIRAYSGEPKGEIFSTSIFSIFAKIVVISIGLMIILQALDVSITPLLTALGVGGLAVALALQDTLGNLFAGLNILFSGKVKVGDYIKLQSGEEGYVIDITWRSTTIRQLTDNYVIIPNSRLASSITINYNLPKSALTVNIGVGVAYDSDLEKVERITLETAREVLREIEGNKLEKDPWVRFHTFGDSSIDLNVALHVNEYSRQFIIKHEFVKRLHKRYREEGIVIPFPIRTLEFAKGVKNPFENNNPDHR